MHETPAELAHLQQILDASADAAGPHMAGIITADRRLTAEALCERLQGMCLLVLGTVTADGRPLVGPVDGYWIHGAWHFSSGRNSVRMRHIARRPAVSATHLPRDEFSVTVHGRAALFDMNDPAEPDLRQAMLDYYLPRQGPSFEDWLDAENPIGGRIAADKLFVFAL